jgi:hypothetical protein
VIRERRGSNFPKGTFKARNLQTRIFSQFLSSAPACAKIWRDRDVFSQAEGPILLRAVFRAPAKSFVIPNGFIVRNLLFAGSSPATARAWVFPIGFSRCGKHLEILCAPSVDRIFAALYGCKVSRTVGFGHAGSPAEKSSPGLNSRRSGGSRFGL